MDTVEAASSIVQAMSAKDADAMKLAISSLVSEARVFATYR